MKRIDQIEQLTNDWANEPDVKWLIARLRRAEQLLQQLDEQGCDYKQDWVCEVIRNSGVLACETCGADTKANSPCPGQCGKCGKHEACECEEET